MTKYPLSPPTLFWLAQSTHQKHLYSARKVTVLAEAALETAATSLVRRSVGLML